MMIYADNAATTKMSEKAFNAMLPYLREQYGNPSSLHTVGQETMEALQKSREKIAACLNCLPKEITFTSGGSEADNQAILSAGESGWKKGKKHIISTAFEHHAVLNTLEKLKNQGYEITLLDVHEDGIVRPEELKKTLRNDTCLVTIMYANNEIGMIQRINEIGRICREHGVIFHTDAVQAAGHLHIDVKEQNIDMLSLSAHKFHGPKGCGVLYTRTGIPLTGIIEGGAQERGKRTGTENIPAIVGAAAALEEATQNIDKNIAYISKLRDRLIDGLAKIPHSSCNGAKSPRLPGNVSYCFEGIEGESILLSLDGRNICASSGSACTSGSLEPSHVLLAIGRTHEIAHGSLRLTLSAENTAEEVDYMIKEITDTVAYLRGMSPLWHDMIRGIKPFML